MSRSARLFPYFVALCVLLGVPLSAAGQAAKPNLSGTWILDRPQSESGPHSRSPDLYKIKHSEPRIEMFVMVEGKGRVFFFTTDSKEHVANIGDDKETRAKAYWRGSSLIIEKIESSGLYWESSYTLSKDGRKLVINHHVAAFLHNAAFDEVRTYTRKE